MGRKHTAESRLKISSTRKRLGLKPSREALLKASVSRKVKGVGPETKEKIRRAMQGRKITWGEKISASKRGRPNYKLRGENNPAKRPEVRQKISQAKKRRRTCFRVPILRTRTAKKETRPERILREAFGAIGFPAERGVRLSCANTFPDFCIPRLKLAIYVDGSYWHGLPKTALRDESINERLSAAGWQYIRFSDADIYENAPGCAEMVKRYAGICAQAIVDGRMSGGGIRFRLR